MNYKNRKILICWNLTLFVQQNHKTCNMKDAQTLVEEMLSGEQDKLTGIKNFNLKWSADRKTGYFGKEI